MGCQPGCSVLMSSTPLAYPQVISCTFASFRVPKFGVLAGQFDFCAGFDSRQLHQKGRGDTALFRVNISSHLLVKPTHNGRRQN